MKQLRALLIFFIIAFLACAFSNAAEQPEYEKYAALEVLVDINATLNIEPKETDYKIDSITANLTFFPKTDDRQFVLSSETKADPQAEISTKENSIIYTWEGPKQLKLIYFYQGRIKTTNTFPKIMQKVNFPIREVPVEYKEYVMPTEFIDFNDAIKNKAYEIAEGETDLYDVMFKIAGWVRENVHYDLNTWTEKAVQKSSWVYENRTGVCDEITNLFISMMRSIGVPARFAAGQAFTNLNNKFGSHGWAEVYFPGEGWVPVDVTFGQYGWIDPTHVKFQTTADSGTSSADYSWKSYKDYGVNIDFESMKVTSKVQQTAGEIGREVELEIEPLGDKVGVGSFVPLKVKIKNPNPYYIPLNVHLTKAPGIEGENLKAVLVKPLQEKYLFFMLKVPDDAEENMIYVSTIEAKANDRSMASAELSYSKEYPKADKSWAESSIKSYEEIENKEYSPEISLKCSFDKGRYYIEETATLSCEIGNKGNIVLKGLSACVDGAQCRDIELGISDKKEEKWTIFLKSYKTRDITASVESKNIAAYSYNKLKIIEVPKIEIAEFSPSEVEYNKRVNMSFTLKTSALAKDVKVVIKRLGEVEVNSLPKEYTFEVPFNSKDFLGGDIEFLISYQDEAGKPYETSYKQAIDIKDIPWYLKFWMWLDSLI